MTDQASANGAATPTSSKLSTLALTEYSAIPTPTSEKDEYKGPESPPSWDIPNAFLLPNGYPDVRPFLPTPGYFASDIVISSIFA